MRDVNFWLQLYVRGRNYLPCKVRADKGECFAVVTANGK